MRGFSAPDNGAVFNHWQWVWYANRWRVTCSRGFASVSGKLVVHQQHCGREWGRFACGLRAGIETIPSKARICGARGRIETDH